MDSNFFYDYFMYTSVDVMLMIEVEEFIC